MLIINPIPNIRLILKSILCQFNNDYLKISDFEIFSLFSPYAYQLLKPRKGVRKEFPVCPAVIVFSSYVCAIRLFLHFAQTAASIPAESQIWTCPAFLWKDVGTADKSQLFSFLIYLLKRQVNVFCFFF